MSLILDALRKSEAERRRGQAPDLFAPVAATTAARGKPPVAMIAVALAAMLAAAIIVFWPTQPSRKSASSDDVAATAAAPAPSTLVSPPTLPAVVPITAAPPSAMPLPDKAGKPEPRNSEAAPPAEIPIVVPPPPAPIAVAPAPSTVPAPPSNADSEEAAVDEPALPTLATLDSTTRATLPPLQLSMHVWNPDATRRFAIIDGQRFGEGGKLAGAVVAEIRRDGVVLDINGRQYLLPRP